MRVKLVGANGTSSFSCARAAPGDSATPPPTAADSAVSSERRRRFGDINRMGEDKRFEGAESNMSSPAARFGPARTHDPLSP